MSVLEYEAVIKRINQLLGESVVKETSSIELEALLDYLDNNQN
jgi:hypothetical protein